jgi:hypothetical protein
MVLLMVSVAWAKVDLVTLPARETVQLTIYNSADLTLARESRALTLKEGANALQFSWANTLIDPTSLEMLPRAHAGEIDIAELVYPPRVRNLGLWNITSEVSGKVPVEISYLTSGLSWRAFYMGTLSPDEKTMRLQAYVRVTNNSGEDYANAQVRLIVGKVHLLDEIAQLARRQYPYGTPVELRPMGQMLGAGRAMKREMENSMVADQAGIAFDAELALPKQVVKEGLSEYFLYTIEGTETIVNGFSKRLSSFEVDAVPVVNLYKFEEQRYGPNVMRFLSFANDEDHDLGATPIPGGALKVYRDVGSERHLSYVGQSEFKYVPVNEDVELNLGAVCDIVVEPVLKNVKTDSYRFDRSGNVAGWDEIRTFEVKARNTRDIPVKVEVQRHFDTSYWTLARAGEIDEFEKADSTTVKFTLQLPARSQKTFVYSVTTYQGTRREDWSRLSR